MSGVSRFNFYIYMRIYIHPCIDTYIKQREVKYFLYWMWLTEKTNI